MILKRFLEAEGYEVFYAGNGRIALAQYPEVKPDLVLRPEDIESIEVLKDAASAAIYGSLAAGGSLMA